MSIVTLTTDFGLQDWFVGTMKGVILRVNPRATVIDLTHEIPTGDIHAGAFALAAAFRFFAKGSVHVAIVDPGVGSERRPIAVETDNYIFVGPDNGVLSLALAQEKIKAVRVLTRAEFFLESVSHTFHGRDIFAPVSAFLSGGLALSKLGSRLKDFVRITPPEPRVKPGAIDGEVVYVDRFGNAITNIVNTMLESRRHWECFLSSGPVRRVPIESHYQAVPPGRSVAVPGSTGFLEIAINGGSAQRELGTKVGTRIRLRLAAQPGAPNRRARRAQG